MKLGDEIRRSSLKRQARNVTVDHRDVRAQNLRERNSKPIQYLLSDFELNKLATRNAKIEISRFHTYLRSKKNVSTNRSARFFFFFFHDSRVLVFPKPRDPHTLTKLIIFFNLTQSQSERKKKERKYQ